MKMKRKEVVEELRRRVELSRGAPDQPEYWHGFRVGCEVALELLTWEVEPAPVEGEHVGTITNVRLIPDGVHITCKLDNVKIVTEEHVVSHAIPKGESGGFSAKPRH